MKSKPAPRNARDLAWLSNGYYESCAYLCNAMIEDDFPCDFGRVHGVLFLCHHSLELHFKASIIAGGQKPKNIHDLAELDKQYSLLYPRFLIEPPPIIKVTTYMEADLFPETSKFMKGRLHERLRYVTNKDGTRWPRLPKFDPSDFAEELMRMRKQMYPIQMPLLYGKLP